MKKFVAALLTAVMAMSLLCISAFAADTYTITAPSNGHTYEVYQIFTGDLNDGVLSNVEAGKNFKGTDAAAAAEALDGVTGTNAAKLSAITPYVDLTGDPYTTVKDGSVSVPAGYYLVKDVDGSQNGKDDAYTLYIVAVVGNTSITPKTDTPEVEKKVKDTNDSTGATTGWQDSADYDIGDSVPYQITATMGDLSAYQTYYVEFTDTMSAGLTYNNDAKVTLDGKDVTSSFTVTCSNNVMTAVCGDVIVLGAAEDSQIVVTYTCTLNENAVIGAQGNANTVKLTYSNNPNNSGNGTDKPGDTGETPEDKNVVFTYKVVANKITEDKQALTGASFKLEKVDAKGSVIKDLGTIDGTQLSTFTWTGIDDGNYVITETVTPAGYNSIDPISFTVTASHDADSADPQLTELSGGELFTGDVATGAVTADIVNESGATLPTTGGMGTTLFYVIGAVLVLGAGLVLITRKRMAND